MFVPKLISLSLVPTGSQFNYGRNCLRPWTSGCCILETRGEFDLRVVTNAGYKVSFSSMNNGVLRHVDKRVATVVPYEIQVDSASKKLTGSRNEPAVVVRDRSCCGRARTIATYGSCHDREHQWPNRRQIPRRDHDRRDEHRVSLFDRCTGSLLEFTPPRFDSSNSR